MKADRIFETVLYAEDLPSVKLFYQDVLGLELIEESTLFLVFRLPESVLILFNPKESEIQDRPIPFHGTYGPGHVAFAASQDSIPGWRKQFAKHGVEIEKEVTWEKDHIGLYIRDPAGNSVELAPSSLWGGGWDF